MSVPVPESSKDERRSLSRGRKCPECGVPRVLDQRYCLNCGARLGSLPAAIAAQIGRAKKFATGRIPVVKAPVAPKAPAGDGKKGWPHERSDFMPSPRAAAAAVIGMLALGVALGSATNELAQSAGISTILVEAPEPPAEEQEEETPEIAAAPKAEPSGAETASAVTEPPTLVPKVPSTEPPSGGQGEDETVKPPVPPGLPEIKHVFVIMLGENSYEETFGETSQSPYLSEELPAKGELVPNYYAVSKGELANQIALISGQGPTPETQANCPNYTDVAPGTESTEGQVEGNGCVYPATTKTLPGQLEERELTWKAYVEGSEDGAAVGQATSCRHPAVGSPDLNQSSTATDSYITWRNPFVYFHSIIDGEACAKADVGLPNLTKDLQGKAEKFPTLAYIAPNACHKGGEAPCEEGALSRPAASEEFLKTIVPEIQESFAYKDGGLIVITSAEARQGGEKPDSSSCCLFPTYPNLPLEPEEQPTGLVKATGGGGKVGAVLLSPFIEPGMTSETYFNHYSLLVTIEEFFGLERIGYAAEPLVVGFDEEMFSTAG
jgi:phosphatidylinositol-3-phosphatase